MNTLSEIRPFPPVLTFILFASISSLCFAQQDLLQSGPMLGYADYREVLLWVQTKAEAKVHFTYYEIDNSAKRYRTADFATKKNEGCVAKLVADQVEPGKRYWYDLYINNKLVKRPYPTEFQTLTLWQWRTDPPEFTVATGSCFYVNEEQYDRPGTPYGSEYEIMQAIHSKRPDLMLWLGDNTYLREVDWNTWTGIIRRWTNTRSIPELQPLLASTHHYMIWDDHDYGPNDSDRGFWNKEQTLAAFKLFSGNPNYGVHGAGGIASRFEWGDVEFFLLDNRWFRTPNRRLTGERHILGNKQIHWIIDALSTSRATFKIVAIGGQVLNTAAVYENYANYEEERTEFLDAIKKNGIQGVFFIDGDRHHTELTMMPREETYPLYDLTVSSLTAGVNTKSGDEANTLRVQGTHVMKHNFATLKFSGPRKERVMTITIFDKDGNEIWTRRITAKELGS